MLHRPCIFALFMKRIKKPLIIFFVTIIIAVIVIIACISPICKYLIEKYDKKYTGREITMSRIYVNPFTGYLNISNLKINEFENDTIFFSAKDFSVNISMLKLFFKKYEVTEVTINQPRGIVKQRKKEFNFSDLIERFSSKDSKKKKKEPAKYYIQNIKIKDGTFYYRETETPVYYYIKKVNIDSEGISWNVDTIPIIFSFTSGTGVGDMKGDFTINTKNKDYSLNIKIKKFDLNIVGQYIKDLSNYGNFKAFLDADFHSKGNIIDREDVTASGKIKISDFHFGKNPLEDYASFEKLEISIHQVSPKKLIYFYDSVTIHKPYFKYEKYDYLDNVQTAFGKAGANVKAASAAGAKYNLVIEIAKYIKILSKNFLRSNYRVDRLGIYDGELKFNDYSLNEKFSMELKPFNFVADSIEKQHKRVKFIIKSGIKPYGNLNIAISINPKDSSDFDLNFKFAKLPTSMFNPYLTKFTSFPLDRGTIEVQGVWTVKNGEINSTNHLVIIDPRVGERIRNNNSKWIPMRFIMFFVRERGNVIDYEVPIKGDLKNPKFILKDVIFDALGNIFIKPPTTPYRMEVRNVEAEIEKSLALKWEIRKSTLTKSQSSFLASVADFIDDNPNASITVMPNNYEVKEIESILLFEAKKKYYIQSRNIKGNNFGEDDSVFVEKMSIKDSMFVSYLNKNTKDSMLFTIQDKCAVLLNSSMVDAKLNKLYQDRINVFKQFFEDDKNLDRVKIVKGKNVVPFNGYSYFKIDYKGEFPEKLLKAYRRMNLLNNESPRDKYNRKTPWKKHL